MTAERTSDPVPAPDGWMMPAGYTFTNLGHCRSCQAPVAWTITPTGRRMPLDRDGTSHFATCPQADQWRKR